MKIEPMTAEEIRDALADAEQNKGVMAVLALLKGLEVDAEARLGPGQPEPGHRDYSMQRLAFAEAQETVLGVIEKARGK